MTPEECNNGIILMHVLELEDELLLLFNIQTLVDVIHFQEILLRWQFFPERWIQKMFSLQFSRYATMSNEKDLMAQVKEEKERRLKHFEATRSDNKVSGLRFENREKSVQKKFFLFKIHPVRVDTTLGTCFQASGCSFEVRLWNSLRSSGYIPLNGRNILKSLSFDK